jgi:hypothetical protein
MKPRFGPCKPFLQIYRRTEHAPVLQPMTVETVFKCRLALLSSSNQRGVVLPSLTRLI